MISWPGQTRVAELARRRSCCGQLAPRLGVEAAVGVGGHRLVRSASSRGPERSSMRAVQEALGDRGQVARASARASPWTRFWPVEQARRSRSAVSGFEARHWRARPGARRVRRCLSLLQPAQAIAACSPARARLSCMPALELVSGDDHAQSHRSGEAGRSDPGAPGCRRARTWSVTCRPFDRAGSSPDSSATDNRSRAKLVERLPGRRAGRSLARVRGRVGAVEVARARAETRSARGSSVACGSRTTCQRMSAIPKSSSTRTRKRDRAPQDDVDLRAARRDQVQHVRPPVVDDLHRRRVRGRGWAARSRRPARSGSASSGPR